MPLDGPAPDSEKVNAAEAEEEQSKEKKKDLPSSVIYAGIVVVMVVAGYFAGTKFFGSAEKAGEAAVTEANDQSDGENGDKVSVATEMIELEDIIVNPAGTGGTRFLAASIGFEISGAKTAQLFESKMPMVRDALISILGSKTIEQLSDAKEKEITRYQIKKRVEYLLKTKNLEAVYFTNFVLQ